MAGPGGMAGAVSEEGYLRYWEKVLTSEGGPAVEQTTQGVVAMPKLPELKEFGQCFQAQDGMVGVSRARSGVGLVCPFQIRIFYDSL